MVQEVFPSSWEICSQMSRLSAGVRTESLRVSRRIEISFWFFIWFLFLWFFKVSAILFFQFPFDDGSQISGRF